MNLPMIGKTFPSPGRSGSPRRTQDYVTIVLFLLPGVVLFILFLVYPIIRSAYYSLYNWNGMGPATKFVALNNYRQILSDPVFLKGVKNCFLIVVLSLAVQLPLALALAIMVGRDLPGRVFFRAVFFMPYVISEVITGIVWISLLDPDPQRGLINALLILIPGVHPQNFLGDLKQVLPCIFIVLTWKYFGLHMLLDMAGLQNIPHEIEEAALIDGATNWQMLTNVTIPLLEGTLRTSIYLSVLGSLTQFPLVWIMTGGGPVHASEFMATYMYQYSFKRLQLGYGSAVALVMLVICLVFSVTFLQLNRRPDHLSGL